uniref:Uncharacterized protein n=1 Tax=Zosterops lateralis melanops TaxID=1220523 RepID=A0A8D2NKD8_ZOSLA
FIGFLSTNKVLSIPTEEAINNNCQKVIIFPLSPPFLLFVMCENLGSKDISISEFINCCRNAIGLTQIWINYMTSTSELLKLHLVKHKGKSLRKARKAVPYAAICCNTCSTKQGQ